MMFKLTLFTLAFVASICSASTPVDVNTKPTFSKVMIVVLENTNFAEALKQPFLSKIATQGALLTNYHGVFHPSQPNYLAMTSGSMQRVLTDANVTVRSLNIVDLLERAHKTWKVYAEQYPGNCFLGAVYGKYAKKHNPFISYANVQSNPQRCANIVNANEFAVDVSRGQIADYTFYVPDLDNDGHDTNPRFSDNWLRKTFEPILSDTRLTKGLLFVVTFDESESYLNNHIFTAFYGENVIPGVISNRRYSHYSLLRTIEEAWDLGHLHLGDTFASSIKGIWR